MALRMLLDGEAGEVEIQRRRPRLVAAVDGTEHEAEPALLAGGVLTIAVDGRPLQAHVAVDGNIAFLQLGARVHRVVLVDPREASGDDGHGDDDIRAPMPGAVVAVHRSSGDAVRRGDAIMTIESMKLQTTLAAPRDGVLEQICCEEGQTFDRDQVVARLRAEGI